MNIIAYKSNEYCKILSDFVKIQDRDKNFGIYDKKRSIITVCPKYRHIEEPIIFCDDNNIEGTETNNYCFSIVEEWFHSGSLGVVDLRSGEEIVKGHYNKIDISESGFSFCYRDCYSDVSIDVYNMFTRDSMSNISFWGNMIIAQKAIYTKSMVKLCEYESMEIHDEFVVYKENNGFGIIDKNAVVVFKPQPYPIVGIESNYVVLVKNRKEIGAVNYDGELAYPFVCIPDGISECSDYYGSSRLHILSSGYAMIKFGIDISYRIYNEFGEIEWGFFNEFEMKGKFYLITENTSYKYLIDIYGNEICDSNEHRLRYIDNKDKYFIVSNSFGHGLINDKGECLIPYLYRELSFYEDGMVKANYLESTEYDIYTDRTEYNVILLKLTYNNQIVLDLPNNTYMYINGYHAAILFNDKFVKVYYDKQCGLIDRKGVTILSCIFDKISLLKDVIIVKMANKKAMVNQNGEFVTQFIYNEIESVSNDRFIVSIDKCNDCAYHGLIDANGNTILDVVYDSITFSYSNNIFRFLSVEQNGSYMLYDLDGNILSNDKWQYIGDVKEGFAKVKKDNLWGFVNEKGEIVVKPQFSSVLSFENGEAICYAKDKTFIIDKTLRCRIAYDYLIEDNRYFDCDDRYEENNYCEDKSWEDLGKDEMEWMLENGGDWIMDN